MDLNQQLIADTKGFLHGEEGRALYEFALEAADSGPCLEIGSYCGKSALYLGAACKAKGGILFSIDHHYGSQEQQPGEAYFDPALFDPRSFQMDTFALFRKTIRDAELEDTVVPIVTYSDIAARAWQIPLSLLFIDGGHSLDTVRRDYNHWAGHLMSGGYLLFHDIYTRPEDGGQAPRLIYERALASGLFSKLPTIRTLGVLKRK